MLGKAVIPLFALALMALIGWTIYAIYAVYVKKVWETPLQSSDREDEVMEYIEELKRRKKHGKV